VLFCAHAVPAIIRTPALAIAKNLEVMVSFPLEGAAQAAAPERQRARYCHCSLPNPNASNLATQAAPSNNPKIRIFEPPIKSVAAGRQRFGAHVPDEYEQDDDDGSEQHECRNIEGTGARSDERGLPDLCHTPSTRRVEQNLEILSRPVVEVPA
jgi:hypothetical protein